MKTINVFERMIAAAAAVSVTFLVVTSMDSIADGYVRPALHELPKTASAPCIPGRYSGG